jgi:hypothetical protein
LGDLTIEMQPAMAPSCKSLEMLQSRLHADVRVCDAHVARNAFIEARKKLNGHIAAHGRV